MELDNQAELVINGVYRHYKGKNYKVLTIANNSENKAENLVIYEALYDEHRVWARPLKMFLEEVEVDGQLKSRFEYLSKDDSNFEDKYKRALADYQNLLKQTAKERLDFVKYANEQVISEILPIYDNLKTSLQFSDEAVKSNGWLEGIKHVIKQFKDFLNNNGIEEITTVNQQFDHNLMEAISNEETDDKKKDGLVAKEIKAGYKLNGKVIVAARVIVYKFSI